MHPRVFTLRLVALLLVSALSVRAAPSLSTYLDDRLVRLRGGTLEPLPPGALAGKSYVALYFSAEWCAPCKKFTPLLVDYYQQVSKQRSDFEVVYVSQDRSVEQMTRYMEQAGFRFPAIAWEKVKASKRITNYSGQGIPCLILLDAEGRVLHDTFDGPVYRGPYVVLDEIKARLGVVPAPVH
jgi:nucleoredoxin